MGADGDVSVLYREPKLLKGQACLPSLTDPDVSVLYREPKLLKDLATGIVPAATIGFSALP